MIRRAVKRALIGFVIGMAVGVIIAVVLARLSHETTIISSEKIERFGSETTAMLVQALLSGILGAVSMAGTVFYEIEDWSLLKAALLHYLLIISCYTLIGLYMEWFPCAFTDIAVAWFFMGIGYLIIWLIMYFRYKAEVKELNEMLERNREEDK